MLVIKRKNDNNAEIPYYKEFLFNIKDYNKIIQRLYNVNFLDIEYVNVPYLDDQTVNDFVKNSAPSKMSLMRGSLIEYREGNKDFWKNYS